MTIYIDIHLTEDLLKKIKNATKGDICLFKNDIKNDEDYIKVLQKADIIFGNPKPTYLSQYTVNRSRRTPMETPHGEGLLWLQLGSAGFEYYRDIKTDAVVTNMQDFFSVPCAETMMAGILSLYRGIDTFVDLKREKHWVGHHMRPDLFLLSKKKVLILGAGSIAKSLAKMLKGFDCKIHFYARTKRKGVVNTVEEVEALIPKMDIIVGCLPGTDEVKGFFTPKMIGLMQPTALFCNVGRGNLVADEKALVDALKNGKIGGAVLDVTVEEPIPLNNPLWDCPNIILSQHSGGGDEGEFSGMVSVFLDNYKRFRKGGTLLNVIELGRGY